MLKFLGVGAAYNYQKNNNCAYFIIDKKLYLLDCGEKICDKLLKEKLLDGIDEVFCLITHLHSDHVGSLEPLLYYIHYFTDKKIYIFYPKKNRLKKLLKLMGITFKFEVFSNFNLIKDIRVEPVVQKHIYGSYGFFIYTDKENIFYSGDTSVLNERAVDELKSGKICKIYHEVTISQKSMIHTHISVLENAFPKEIRNKVYLMHIANKKTEETAKELGFMICEEE